MVVKVRGNIAEQFITFALLVEGRNITSKLFGLLTLMYTYMYIHVGEQRQTSAKLRSLCVRL